MKKIVTLILAATMLLSLIGCVVTKGDKSNNDSVRQESSINERNESIVLVDNNVIKVTYVGLGKSSIFGYEINVEIENKTSRGIIVQTREVSIDGVMVQPIFSCDIEAGKKAKDSMSISEDKVSELINIEGLFYVFDNESWNEIGNYEFSLFESESSSNKDENEGTVLVDNEIVKIEYMGKGEDSIFGPILNVKIENETDRTITVQTKEVSVDGFMIDPIFNCNIVAGKKANDNITFMEDNVTELTNIKGKFKVIDRNNWSDLGEYTFTVQ